VASCRSYEEGVLHLAVITESGLVRSGARVVAALKPTHGVSLHTVEQVAAMGLPGEATSFLYIGDVPEAERLHSSPALYDAHGTRWGYQGTEAWIQGGGSDDPKATLEAINVVVSEMEEIAGVELLLADDPKAFTGVHFAGRFLDPYLKVEAQTVVAGTNAFTHERMCWERQYTLGIASFLQDGFDNFAAG
jgi:hypothetical protein